MLDFIKPLIQENAGLLITSVLGFGLVGVFLSKFLKILKEISDLLVVFLKALSDKRLTQEELREIAKEADDVRNAVKSAFGKK